MTFDQLSKATEVTNTARACPRARPSKHWIAENYIHAVDYTVDNVSADSSCALTSHVAHYAITAIASKI